VVEVGATLVATFAVAVGEPADCQQIRRLEQTDAVGQVQPQTGVEFFSDVRKAGVGETGVYLVIG
jgi:hypothetical protein